MTVQFAEALQNAVLDAIETHIGASAVLKLRTGAPPGSLGAADQGTVLATINLAADWMAAAASGQKDKTGTWEDTSADASGDAGHFRLYTNGGVAKIQGTITATGGGGDMTMASITITAGDLVPIGSFSFIAGND